MADTEREKEKFPLSKVEGKIFKNGVFMKFFRVLAKKRKIKDYENFLLSPLEMGKN